MTALGESREHVLHPRAALECVVQRLVVRAVDTDELVDAPRIERDHLRLEPGTADGSHQLLVAPLPADDGLGGVPHRREDDRA